MTKPLQQTRHSNARATETGVVLHCSGDDHLGRLYRAAYGQQTVIGGERYFAAWFLQTLGRLPHPNESVELPSHEAMLDTALGVERKILKTATALVGDGITLTDNARRRKNAHAQRRPQKVATQGALLQPFTAGTQLSPFDKSLPLAGVPAERLRTVARALEKQKDNFLIMLDKTPVFLRSHGSKLLLDRTLTLPMLRGMNRATFSRCIENLMRNHTAGEKAASIAGNFSDAMIDAMGGYFGTQVRCRAIKQVQEALEALRTIQAGRSHRPFEADIESLESLHRSLLNASGGLDDLFELVPAAVVAEAEARGIRINAKGHVLVPEKSRTLLEEGVARAINKSEALDLLFQVVSSVATLGMGGAAFTEQAGRALILDVGFYAAPDILEWIASRITTGASHHNEGAL